MLAGAWGPSVSVARTDLKINEGLVILRELEYLLQLVYSHVARQ